jgi:beta-lactamase regulating signal transducer with metallopeptidase domain/protocatechuate 3,4-dioxygenase beta subunit
MGGSMIDFINSTAEMWSRYMTSATAQALLLALAVLIIVSAGRRLSPALRHALLMLALIKFAIPPTLSLPTGLFSRLSPNSPAKPALALPYVAPIAPVVNDALWPPVEISAPLTRGMAPAPGSAAVSPAPRPTPQPTLKAWLMLVHLLGALLFATLVIRQKFRLRRLAARAETPADEALQLMYDSLATQMKLARKPRLLLSPDNHSPMTFGIWNPVVLMPGILVETLPADELKVILGHELAHQRRWDLWLSWMQVPISAVWWFNPVYWLLLRRIRSVREDCCDDLVVASGLASGEGYCKTLLQAARVASGSAMAGAALAYIGESHPLRRRFQRIMSAKLITKPRLAWTGILLILLLGFLLLPGVQKRVFHRAQTNQQDTAKQIEKEPAPVVPASADQSAADSPQSVLIQDAANLSNRTVLFHIIDAKDGQGIAGATLYSGKQLDPEAEPPASQWITDRQGNCAVVVAPPTSVTVIAAAYLTHAANFPYGEYIPAEYTFKLEKGITVGGTVRNEEGQPISNVRIGIRASYEEILPPKLQSGESLVSAIVRTDDSGRWHSQNVPQDPKIFIVLDLNHAGYVQSRYWTRPEFQSSNQEFVNSIALTALLHQEAVFTMKQGFIVSIGVSDENGQSVEGAAIIQGENAGLMGLRLKEKGTTGPDGRFSFIGAKPGEVTIIVQAKGLAPASQTIRIEPNMPPIQFRLAKGNLVTGRVVDMEGKPIAGASISITPSAVNREQFPWQAKSDAEGRFTWDSAPAFPMYFSVTADGYKLPDQNEMAFFLLEPGKENEIRLQKLTGIQITGRVFDEKTRASINEFKVIPFLFSSPMGPMFDGNNGEFSWTLTDRLSLRTKPEYSIRVEAQGYVPYNSAPIDLNSFSQKLDFGMVRGEGIQGIVRLPGGEPAVGAKVFLFGATSNPPGSTRITSPPMMMSRGALSYGRQFTETVTADESGKFSFNPMPEAHTMAAVHEKGLITAIPAQLGASPVLILQPWGGIEGTVKVGNKEGANQMVLITRLSTIRLSPPGIMVSLSANTDSQGRFSMEMVPAGEYRITSNPIDGSFSTGSAAIVVKSGQTAPITLGGTGRPLIGRFIIADSEVPVTWARVGPRLSLILPDTSAPSQTDEVVYRIWAESEEGKQRLRAEAAYSLRLSSDGSFRVEDLPAGRYLITINARMLDPTRRDLGPEADFKREVVVPAMPGGRSDEPLDLGIITLQLPPKK